MKAALMLGGLITSLVTAVPGLTAGTPDRPLAAPALREVVIQGRVTEVHDGWAVVQTPDWRPTCPPGKVCAQYIIPGVSYRVDTGGAEFQTAAGQPIDGELFVGENVVIFGTVAARGTQPGPVPGAGEPAGSDGPQVVQARIIE
ncbi:MAG: hypothetical protein IRY98_07975, partial [Alicyclobacillaceae bacterium]|nr:hypothetical protein [Alicyclobacillaceae bacterium]